MKRAAALLTAGVMAIGTIGAVPAAAEPAMNIAIVSSPSGVDDGSFNENCYDGILAYIEENADAKVTPLREETGDVTLAVQLVADVVADYDIIVCCGYQFASIGTIAEENPDTSFILIDSYPTNEDGEETEYDNVYAMQFAEQESGFFAGIAAAVDSKTKKVAVVNGIAYPSNVNYEYGFEAGVNYANAKYNAGCEYVELASYAGTDVFGNNVGGNYIGSFADPETGKVLGNALIDEGVDVIFVAAGDSGNGVFTAAKESESAMVIGCDVDQYDDGEAGGRNIILTSGLKCMDINVTKQLELFAAGEFEGQNALLDITTDSTGYVSEEGRQQLSEEALADLADAYETLKSGAIELPTGMNGILPDDFPGLS